jgi:hypothetical protein
MLTWGAIFADDPDTEILIDEGDADSDMLARFDAAAREGYYGARQIHGMWITDASSDDVRVVRFFGGVPTDMRQRWN